MALDIKNLLVQDNVGIGNNSPAQKLEVSASDNQTHIRTSLASQPSSYYLDLKTTVTPSNVRWNYSMVNNGTAYNDMLVFNSGNIGLGTTNPTEKLDVNGNIKATGATINGNVAISGILDLTNAGVIGALDLSNNSIIGVNNVEITDPGPNEGITWAGGNLWKIYESPNDLTTNTLGNLQIVQNTTRRATFNTSGQLDIPIATGTAPLLISSTTAVSNLNADLLDDKHFDDVVRYGHVYGKAQSAITKGQAVQFAGVQGDHILIKPAVPSEINANPDYFVGIARDSLNTNNFGYIVTFGEIIGTTGAPLDTATNFNEGDILWFASGGSTPGALTSTEPTGTNAKIQVGAVTKENATEGILLVRVDNVGVQIADLMVSGTASGSTFLRGDGQWATPSDTDTNTYVTSAAFNTSTGVLTLTRNDAGTVTVDLDGKYAEDNAVVKLTGAQTVGGVKTFSNSFTGAGTNNAAVIETTLNNGAIVGPISAAGLYIDAAGTDATNHSMTGIFVEVVGGSDNSVMQGYGIDGISLYNTVASPGKYLKIKPLSGTSALTTLQTNSATSSDITVTLPSSTGTLVTESHSHGDINALGTITSTAVSPENGDYIIISDANNATANTLKRGIAIGTSTTTFLRNDGTWATPSGVDNYVNTTGDTMTGNLTISKVNPQIILSETDASTTTYPSIQFDTANNQGVNLYHTEFDSELPVAGYGLVLGPSVNNTQWGVTGTLTLAVLGEIYAGSTTLGSTNKVFHDGYHPNADILTTARTLTIGSTGKTFNGSANVSWSLEEIGAAATSHTHAISDVTNLQTSLDAKQNSATALTTSTSFGGDVSGTYNAIVVADDSHNHIISNVDGLQTALDAKAADNAVVKLTGDQTIAGAKTFSNEIYAPKFYITGDSDGTNEIPSWAFSEYNNKACVSSEYTSDTYYPIYHEGNKPTPEEIGAASLSPTMDTKTGNYTLALTDAGKVLRVNSSSAVTITIPANITVAIPVNTEIAIIRYGTGTVSIIPVGVTVTLRSFSNYQKIKDQYTSAALKKIDTNEWILVGNLGA